MAVKKIRQGITISFGIQKGGCGKTSTTALTAYILSNIHKKKVLLIDGDSQGNSTFFITRRSIYDFEDKTVLEIIAGDDPHEHIVKITDNLHVIPAEDHLSDLEEYVYIDWRDKNRDAFDKFEHLNLLRTTIKPLKQEYDYILIDLPPNPSLMTKMGLVASDYAIVLMSCDILCYEALSRYLKIATGIVNNNFNKNLRLLGIAPSLVNSRAAINSGFLEKAKEEYGELVFNTVLYTRVKIQEFAALGISMRTKPEREALSQYISLVKEILERVNRYKKAK